MLGMQMDVRLVGLGIFLFVFPWIGFAAPKSASLLVTAMAIFFLCYHLYHRLSVTDLISPVWFLVVSLLIVAGSSIAWAADPDLAWERFAKLALFLPLGTSLVLLMRYLDDRPDGLLGRIFLVGNFLAFSLLGVHVLTGGGLFALLNPQANWVDWLDAANRPAVILLLLFGVTFLTLRRTGWPLAWPAAILLLIFLLFSRSQTAFAGMIVWFLTYAGMVLFQRFGERLLVWGGVALILLLPAIVLAIEVLNDGKAFEIRVGSLGARMEIWYAVSNKILESPLYGHGLEAARSITDWSTEFYYYNGPSMLHPHNGVLQIWLELGLVGAGLMAAGWAFLASKVRQFAATDRPAIAATLATSLLVLSISHGLWQSWWVCSLFAVAALTLLLSQDKQPDRTNVEHSKH